MHSQNQTTVIAFCVNLKVVSSNFSMIKNVAPPFLSSFPIKLICFKSVFSNSIRLLKSIAINL